MKTTVKQPLNGLLYDLDLLPEQIQEGTREWAIMQVVTQLHNAIFKNTSHANSEVNRVRRRPKDMTADEILASIEYSEIERYDRELFKAHDGEFVMFSDFIEAMRRMITRNAAMESAKTTVDHVKIHIEIMSTEEMRAHAFTRPGGDHDIPFQVYRYLLGYDKALAELKVMTRRAQVAMAAAKEGATRLKCFEWIDSGGVAWTEDDTEYLRRIDVLFPEPPDEQEKG